MSEEENWRSHGQMETRSDWDGTNKIQKIKNKPQMDADLRR